MSATEERKPASPESNWSRVPTDVSTVLATVAGIAILLLMFYTVADVFMRKVFSSGLPGAIEVGEIALVGIVFAGLMAAEVTNAHVRTPVLTERLSPRAANLAHLIGYVPATVFLAWATFLTAQEGIQSFLEGEFRFGLIFIPIWPAKVIIPIGLAGLTVAIVIKLVRTILNIVRSAPAEISDYDNPL